MNRFDEKGVRMRLQSINIGTKQTLQIGHTSFETGIIKTPVTGPVNITLERVGNDVIHNRKAHGGPDQAAYVYGGTDYAWWAKRLGHALPPGILGENLTITDLESGPIRIGDRLVIGTVVLEVTAPRIPCFKLAKRMGEATFVKQFRAARRPGMYCRVIAPGSVCAGDPVTLEPCSDETVTIQEMFDAFFTSPPVEAIMERILAAPIAMVFRDIFAAQLREGAVIQNLNKRIDDLAATV
jgi:MOSC domain-containing protein YiiM